jgi:triacylglycerol esterase/lipase EstA (alpha/beta hydrolase family)
MHLPVLLVHGIWDTGTKLAPIARGLEAAGVPRTACITLSKNDGSVHLMDLAREVAAAAAALGPKIDLVGFSMGALISRAYVQRLGGRDHVRRFVSIAGPQNGTLWARFAGAGARGVRDMAPDSALLRDLETDADPWGDVEVHTLWTPYDGMIVPPRSSVMRGTRSDARLPILVHRWLASDPRAVEHVVRVLTA